MEAPPERGTFCRLKPKRVRILLVVVYERVGKAVRSLEGPERADRRIFMAVRKTRKLPGLLSAPLPCRRLESESDNVSYCQRIKQLYT